jgi:hypothetical protein
MADTHLRTPLLIYIDDHQGGETAKLIAFAQHLNVKVRAFKTSQEFEIWLAHNMGTLNIPSHSFKFLSKDHVLMFLDFLKKYNTGAPRNIRLITDAIHPAYRTEVDIDAGRRVARYFRDRLSIIPILVKTPHNYIEHTRFVKDMWLVGSTCSYSVAKDYIEQLAGVQEHNCSVNCAQYNAH